MEEDVLNDGHWVEALDRTSILINMVHDLLDQHPCIAQCGHSDDVEGIIEKLGSIYQSVGHKMDEWETKNEMDN